MKIKSLQISNILSFKYFENIDYTEEILGGVDRICSTFSDFQENLYTKV